MRRFIVLLGVLVLVAALPGAASAARPTRVTDHSINIGCDVLTAVSGVGSAVFGANRSEQFGSEAFVAYWPTADTSGLPALRTNFNTVFDIRWDGTTLSGTIAMLDASGAPADPAAFSATFVPSGDPFPIDETFKDGNHQHRVTGTRQPLDPSGSLQVGGATFSLDGCFAEEATVTFFDTNPQSFVAHFSSRTVECELENATGDTAFMFVDVHDSFAFVNVFVDAAAGPALDASGGGEIVDGLLDTPLDVFDHGTGQATGDPGSIEMSIVSTGEPFEYLLRNATARVKVQGTVLDVGGSLVVDGHIFDLGPCVLADASTKVIFASPRGPKPGGKALANDLPSGAKLLAVGTRTSAATKGASPDREASFECEVFEDPETGLPFEVPVGHTVWYRIVGTGGPITIDTAGSDYDTVIAVYTANGAGGFTPVPGACVDDVPLDPVGRTLQAAVTFDSVAGVTYYVQIGGFPESFPYGNLRVRVS